MNCNETIKCIISFIRRRLKQMNKQQKNYIKAVVGFVLAAIILCAGIMTALYLMREEKGMENLMAPV